MHYRESTIKKIMKVKTHNNRYKSIGRWQFTHKTLQIIYYLFFLCLLFESSEYLQPKSDVILIQTIDKPTTSVKDRGDILFA